MEVLQEVLDHLRDDVVGLLLILPLIGEVCFGITCQGMGEGVDTNQMYSHTTWNAPVGGFISDFSILYMESEQMCVRTGVQVVVVGVAVRVVLLRIRSNISY